MRLLITNSILPAAAILCLACSAPTSRGTDSLAHVSSDNTDLSETASRQLPTAEQSDSEQEDSQPAPDACDGGQCACVPDCAGRTCGPDQCGGSCGECPGIPCIAVPEVFDFGQVYVGEETSIVFVIKSCSDVPLLITSMSLTDNSDPSFELSLASVYGTPSPEEPLVIPPGAHLAMGLSYAPVDITAHHAKLRIESNAETPVVVVALTGACLEQDCPVAVIQCAEGDEVIPQSILHLFGESSYAPGGKIANWQWDVSAPAGSQSLFVPASTYPNPTFETNVAGIYTFYLSVQSNYGTNSCDDAEFEVAVIPDETIHVELLWHTPEDPDETDTGPEAGADMDLHMLHPWAAGPDLDGDGKADGWFDIPFDCFWFNAHPNWGSYDFQINDDPGLDRDDTDGGGPENINLDIPEDMTYRIGVHYWNDHGFGVSYATVKLYVYAVLIEEVADVAMVDSDMWEVMSFAWPSGKSEVIIDEAGHYKITPSYHNPYFFQ